MPITPLHVGPALLLKRLAGPRFSLSAFLLSQALLDLEPVLKILGLLPLGAGLHVGHTWTTGCGVGLAATAVAWLGLRWWRSWQLRWGRRLVLGWGLESTPSAWSSAAGAMVGVSSHLALDSVYHADVAAGSGLPGLWGLVSPWVLDAGLLVVLCAGGWLLLPAAAHRLDK